MFKVKLIKPELAYSIRQTVLRPNLTVEDCGYDIDKKEGSFHLGAFFNKKLIGIASFSLENYNKFNIDRQYRLRGMAILKDFQRLGAGRLLINYAEQLILEQNIEILWCVGRIGVQGYYEKLGFKTYGEIFYYEPSGDHVIMYKEIESN